MRVLVCVLVLSGCGSLVDERYLGPVQLVLSGDVQGGASTLENVDGKARLALFYFPNGPNNDDDFEALVEDEGTSVPLTSSDRADWKIYDLPEARHFVTTPSGKRYAYAVPYVYFDENGNARRDPGERWLGEAPVLGVIYAPDELSADESPTGRPLVAPVMTQLTRPMWCTARPEEPTDRVADCGVPLGAPCTSNAECGVGECLSSFPWPWPRGYCALEVTSPSTCAPQNAHLWRSHRARVIPGPLPIFWLPACESDRDCRGAPYQCDLGSNVCLPASNLALRLDLPNRLPVCQRVQ